MSGGGRSRNSPAAPATAQISIEEAPALRLLEQPLADARSVARSRALFGASPAWPDGGEFSLLRLWPSTRAAVASRLQAACSVNADRAHIAQLLPALMPLAPEVVAASGQDLVVRDLVRELSRYFGRDFDRYFDRYFVRDFVRDFVRYFGWDFGRDFVRDFVRYFGRDVVRYFVRDFVRDFGRDVVRYFVRDFGRDVVRYVVRDFGRNYVPQYLAIPSTQEFKLLDIRSTFGRAAVRAALARGNRSTSGSLDKLFRVATRASLEPRDAGLRAAASDLSERFDGDTLWPALARHVARLSTPSDRALLTELAEHPERREPPLRWGLQYFVRGDVVFADDTEATLDELCAEAGLPPLPLLEDMPEELEWSELEVGEDANGE